MHEQQFIMKNGKPCIDVIGFARCTGCFGCQAACPIGAIVISLDADGFYKPVINQQTCSECGLCQRRCPVIASQEQLLASAGNWKEPKAYAAWSKDDDVRLSSSSGGFFSELARQVIESGGAVAGCVWGENFTPKHLLAHTMPEVEKMRGSKYAPSSVGNIYQEVIAALSKNESSMIFSGTPCQVAAMDATLSREQRKRVLLVEFICHGVPSLRVFHRYLEELFSGDKVVSYTWNNKAFGWKTVLAVSDKGERHHVSAPADFFFKGFSYKLFLMESCYQCPFAHLPRVADITMGDFWGCPEQLHDKRGVSVVLVNTEKGLKAIGAAQNRGALKVEEVSLAEAVAKNQRAIRGVHPVPQKRRAFMNGMIGGRSFAELQGAFFPGRSELLWRSFINADHKLLFVSNLFIAVLRKFWGLFSAGRQI
jgi:coenzyme F420-reducing hydrogenase beta subunit